MITPAGGRALAPCHIGTGNRRSGTVTAAGHRPGSPCWGQAPGPRPYCRSGTGNCHSGTGAAAGHHPCSPADGPAPASCRTGIGNRRSGTVTAAGPGDDRPSWASQLRGPPIPATGHCRSGTMPPQASGPAPPRRWASSGVPATPVPTSAVRALGLP
jgi:hypothetical protein